jgi:hypothetical protein
LRQRNDGVTKASMERVIPLLVSLTLAGCVSSREVSFQKRASIPAGSAIGVITPPDGVYMEDEYPKSGTVAARKLVAALVPHFPASGVVTPEMNIEYVLKPQIAEAKFDRHGTVPLSGSGLLDQPRAGIESDD